MKTQYKLKMLLWMLICVLFAAGCQRDDTTPESMGSMVDLGLNMGTYALGDDDSNVLSHEKQIRSLHVFIYNADGLLENPGNTKVAPATGGLFVNAAGRINGTWKVYEGRKTIYVIANAPGKLKTVTGSTPTADVLNAPSLYVLQKLCMDADSYDADYCENQGADWTGGLMSGEVTTTVTKTQSEVSVSLARRYARIDLAVICSPELAGSTVKVTAVQWQNFCQDARLLSLSSEWRGASASYKSLGVSYPLTSSSYTRVRPKTGGTQSVEYEIYVMPKPLNGESSIPVSLQLDVDINGKTEPYEIYLSETDVNGVQNPDKPLAIQANKIYKVNATLLSHSTDVEIEIKDWEDQAIKGDIAGSYLVLGQTKVIMDWWTLGRTFTAKAVYASDGNVSFVGYVTKDDTGKETVTTDGSNLPTWLPKANIVGLPEGVLQYGTIMLTYVPTSDEHPDVTLRIKTANITKDITVKYDNGLIPASALSSSWTFSRPSRGLHVAKMGNKLPSGVADADTNNEQIQWATSNTSVPAAQQIRCGYGFSNTSAIITALGSNASAANKCRSLGVDWYLSSRDELLEVYNNRTYLGSSYLFNASYYWSSSEYSGGYSGGLNFSNGSMGSYGKTNGYRVRCCMSL